MSEKYPAHFGHLLFIIERWRSLLLPAAFHRNFKYEHRSCCYLYTGKLYVRLKFLQGKLFKTQLSLKAGLPQQRLGVAHKAIYSAFCILHSAHGWAACAQFLLEFLLDPSAKKGGPKGFGNRVGLSLLPCKLTAWIPGRFWRTHLSYAILGLLFVGNKKTFWELGSSIYCHQPT